MGKMSYCIVDTKHGAVGLMGSEGMLARSTLPGSRRSVMEQLRAGMPAECEESEAAFGELPDKLRRYFSGEQVDFSDVPIDVSGYGPFHAAVLRTAQRIPYGPCVTYLELARMAGSTRAARAAGTAMANNAYPIIVPCHRVVASGGRIGGFASGLEWKRTLLALEGQQL